MCLGLAAASHTNVFFCSAINNFRMSLFQRRPQLPGEPTKPEAWVGLLVRMEYFLLRKGEHLRGRGVTRYFVCCLVVCLATSCKLQGLGCSLQSAWRLHVLNRVGILQPVVKRKYSADCLLGLRGKTG